MGFQSTPPARGATGRNYQKQAIPFISIHAPREGGDAKGWGLVAKQEISIHAPREGGDSSALMLWLFPPDFNPRPPRGGRPALTIYRKRSINVISIHAPREGGDSASISGG